MRTNKVWIIFYYGKAHGPYSERTKAANSVIDLTKNGVDAAYHSWRCEQSAQEFIAWHNYENASRYEHHGI
jgi:hypothetical protein